MAKLEGIIKYQLEFMAGPGLPPELLQELNRWRQILVAKALIGQVPVQPAKDGACFLLLLFADPHVPRGGIQGVVDVVPVVKRGFLMLGHVGIETGPVSPVTQKLRHFQQGSALRSQRIEQMPCYPVGGHRPRAVTADGLLERGDSPISRLIDVFGVGNVEQV